MYNTYNMKERELVPCLRNPDLDCPGTCSVHEKSRKVFRSLADKNGITFEEAVKKAREMDPVKKREIMALIEGGFVILETTGKGVTCANEQSGKIKNTSFGLG